MLKVIKIARILVGHHRSRRISTSVCLNCGKETSARKFPKGPEKIWSKEELARKESYLKKLYGRHRIMEQEEANVAIISELNQLHVGEDINEEESERVEKDGDDVRREEIWKKNQEDLKVWEGLMEETGGKKVEYPHFKAFRNRPLTDATTVFHHNAWDNIEWDEEMNMKAEETVSKNSNTKMECEKIDLLEKEADEKWNKFYTIHQNKFFKDRNWLFTEFPELEGPFGCSVSRQDFEKEMLTKRDGESYVGENSKFKVLEVGCGAGNTVFPLLSGNNNPELFIYCCDFSKTAVDIVRNHEQLEKNRCCPFVLDITDESAQVPFAPNSIDVVVLIFVISAISPDKFDAAMKNINRFLKPGGLVLFRDYGRYDLAQLRFRDGRCISENFYMRGDGTRVYFFTPDDVQDMFRRNGFKKLDISVDRRLQVNRSKQLKMYRVWILAKFVKESDCHDDF